MRFTVISAFGLVALLTCATFGQPQQTPTPTPTPVAHDGPVLAITFAGVFVLKEEGAGYRVILPNLTASPQDPHGNVLKPHIAYARFREDAYDPLATKGFKVSKVHCEMLKENDASIAFAGDALTIEPGGDVISGPVTHSQTIDYLVHLPRLVPTGTQFDGSYNQPTPTPSRVAAQFEITRGVFEPYAPAGRFVWTFLTEKLDKDAHVPLCAAPGITLELRIRKGVTRVDLASSPSRKLALKMAPGATTLITIANSLAEDIKCPDKPLEAQDKHFALQYNLVRPTPADLYIPNYNPRLCATPAANTRNRSHGGSDCLGSQWP
jgi:hypothetical protein